MKHYFALEMHPPPLGYWKECVELMRYNVSQRVWFLSFLGDPRNRYTEKLGIQDRGIFSSIPFPKGSDRTLLSPWENIPW